MYFLSFVMDGSFIFVKHQFYKTKLPSRLLLLLPLLHLLRLETMVTMVMLVMDMVV